MFDKINYFKTKNNVLIKNIQHSGVYFLATILQSAFALIAQPIYSKCMTANDFGVLGYFDAVRGFVSPLFSLGISTYYLMNFFNQGENENKKLLFNLTFFLCCANSVMLFLSYFFLYLYFSQMKVNIPLEPYAWYVLLALVLENIKTILLINFRIRKKAWTYFAFSAINALLNVGLGLYLVIWFKMGVDGRMLAPVISSLMILPFAIYYMAKYTIIDFNLYLFLKALKISFPLAIASYGFVIITNVDRFYLERLNDIKELGLYNIGITIAGYIQFAYIAISQAFEPDIYKGVADRDFKKITKTGVFMLVSFLIIVLFFMFFSGLIISILTAGKFLEAEKYLNITITSVYLTSVFYFFVTLCIAMGKTNSILTMNVIGGLFSIIIMYYATNLYGFVGAAYGKILISIFIVLLSSIIAILQLKKLKATI